MKNLYLFLLLVTGSATLFAQSANDDCVVATALPDVENYCSGAGAFTNVGASVSLTQDQYPICIDERDQIKDVWFSFVATRNSATIRVTGAATGNNRGTLQQPQFALFGGSCGALEDLACRSPFVSGGQVQNGGTIIFNELVRGRTYYVMVGARNGNEGSFELCVDQFDAVPEPSSDCETGVILCDKSPFSVDFLQGQGQVRDDLLSGNISCQSNPQEMNSAWYKWTCDDAGSLNFVITPLGAAFNEDIDFVLYEMSSGIDNCTDRRVLRQMFSGETGGQGAANIPCLGETGLSDADPDNSENCGCDPGNNNFVNSIDMVSGRSYALVIMNFSGSGDGFAIEFGGTGTFLGPDPMLSFSTNEACVGEAIIFEDNSTSLDGIASQEWDFGPTATPRTASGPGPHSVVFGEAGTPNVSLVITTTRDCEEILAVNEVEIICCEDQFTGQAQISDPLCPNAGGGSIAFSATSDFAPGTETYLWSTGATTAFIDGLSNGSYTVTVSDVSGCERAFTYEVSGPEDLVLDTIITIPDCGESNGALEFIALRGGTSPYTYSFNGSDFSNNNKIEDIPESIVTVQVQDANGCIVEQQIQVSEIDLALIEGVPAFAEPSCNGLSDGRLEINISNGTPSYQYDFGNGFQSSSVREGLSAGQYSVDVVDQQGCTGEFDITITDPPLLTLDLQSDNSSCFGTNDGLLAASAMGGRPGYAFSWSDGATDSVRMDVGPGTYIVTLTDDNGCIKTQTATLVDPDEIIASIAEQDNLSCFGDATGSFTLTATGGSPAYTFSSDGENFQPTPTLGNLQAGAYTLYVMDMNGCQDSLSGSLTEPEEFVIDAGPGGRLFLGTDTTLTARSNYEPITYSWGPDTLDCLTANCNQVRVMPVNNTIYTVTGTNLAGCIDTAQVELRVLVDLPTFIPNAISPNGDGVNDNFTIYGGNTLDVIDVLRIYDRWGGLVFENSSPFPANDPTLGWDGTVNGKRVNPAVFVFYAEVRYINGDVLPYSGNLHVVR